MENTQQPAQDEQKPSIKSLSIWRSINSSVKIDCGDGTTVDIELPMDVTKELSFDEIYALLKQKAERYMKCIVSEG